MNPAVRTCAFGLLLAGSLALVLQDGPGPAPARAEVAPPPPEDEPDFEPTALRLPPAEEDRPDVALFGRAPDELQRAQSGDLFDLDPAADPPARVEPEPEPVPGPVTEPPSLDPEPAGNASSRRRLPGRIASGVLLAASALSILVLLAVGVGPHTGLYRTMTVLSGSMRPAFSPGDMIVSTPEPIRDVQVGQVITYQIPVLDHHVETHRVVRILRHGPRPVVITKGDSNNTADPWKAELHGTTIWRVRGTIPYLGWLVYWLRLPQLHRIVILLVPSLLALVWLVGIWATPSRSRRQQVAEGGAGA